MSVGSGAGGANVPVRLRPNPFSFLSDTAARFGLLAFAILGITPILAVSLGQALIPGARATQIAMAACIAKEVPAPSAASLHGKDFATRFGIAAANEGRVTACFVNPSALLVPLAVGAVVVVAVAAFAVYWWLPSWRIRRRGLVPLPDTVVSTIGPLLDDLSAQAGVHGVTFLADPVNVRASGLAFGRFKQRYVALGVALLLPTTDRDAFRTVVLHELAHIRNRDVDPTYLAIAVWRCFALLVLLPSAVLTIVAGPAAWLSLGGRLVLFAALVLLARNAVLRSRELYADARVAQWNHTDPLLGALNAEPARTGRTATLIRAHPDPARRRTVLTQPSLLTRTGWWDGVAVGISTTVAYNTVQLVIGWIAPAESSRLLLLLVVVVFLLPAAFALVLAACRSQLAEVLTGQRGRIDVFALGLGLGFAVSFALSPQTAFLSADLVSPGVGQGVGFAGWLVWGALVVATTWLYMRWVLALIGLRIPRVVTRPSPAMFVMLYSAVVALGLAVWLPFLLGLPSITNLTQRDAFPDFSQITVMFIWIGVELVYAVPTVALFGGIVALWWLPLAPYLRPARGWVGGIAQPWVTTPPPPDGWRPPNPAVRPGWAARMGLRVAVIGIMAVAALYLVAVVVKMTDSDLLNPIGTAVSLLPEEIGVLGTLVAAVLVTARAAAVPMLHGLLAACVPALPITMVGEMIQSVAVCAVNECGSPDFLAAWQLLWLLWPRALLVAFVLAGAMAAARALRARQSA
jgi:Zn-dependent protease with chaperone function